MAIAESLDMEVSDLTQKSIMIVRAEIKGELRPRMFEFVEMPPTNMLQTKFVGNSFLARQNEKNRKFILEQYNML
jgi:hypothetical protein